MTDQAYEILCPKCRAALPPSAPACPSCTPAAQTARATVRPVAAAAANGAADQGIAEEIVNMRIKDYHHLVRANYGWVEGRRSSGLGSPLVPIFLLVALAAALAAAVVFGWL